MSNILTTYDPMSRGHTFYEQNVSNPSQNPTQKFEETHEQLAKYIIDSNFRNTHHQIPMSDQKENQNITNFDHIPDHFTQAQSASKF